ncbi:MAG: hypothetical protein BGO69_00935 [Bacteroidetes bacterium 46-16]|nr:MAG: hypothetical protein BGO69_00935 [Bacteroidetes bacterium 46-16]
MNSAFANLFLLLQQRVQDNVPAITYIDQDLGQINPGVEEFPVTFPCLLIDFEDFKFKNLSEHVQTAEGTVLFKLGFSSYSSSAQMATEASKEAALNFYDIEWDLHKVLQGWDAGDYYGHLDRSSAITQKRPDQLRVRELRYTIAFEDYSTKLETYTTLAGLDVSPGIVTGA